jgi:hypothetical protein
LGAEPAAEGKWTDLLLPLAQRQTFHRAASESFDRLDSYGVPELGTVTGANGFFSLSESTRQEFGISKKSLMAISPPGTKHLKRSIFTSGQWEELRCLGERVWLLRPSGAEEKELEPGVRSYLKIGKKLKVHQAYKCKVRPLWWRPPAVEPPDLFFTYMSHRFPRLIANAAEVGFLNSMHGIRLKDGVDPVAGEALPLLCLNSLTLLGAEIYGRAYGGGVLKMEPREAASLPVPKAEDLLAAWAGLASKRTSFDRAIGRGSWQSVVEDVDSELLEKVIGLSADEVSELREATDTLRRRRMRKQV